MENFRTHTGEAVTGERLVRDELKQLCVENDISHRNMDGKTLRALRLKLDLTQQEMADKLFMSRVMYGMNERGIKPISARTAALATTLPAARE